MSQALAIIGWMSLPEEERPPEAIWLDSRAIADHFDNVEAQRDAKAKGMAPIEDDPSAPMLQNELTKGLRR